MQRGASFLKKLFAAFWGATVVTAAVGLLLVGGTPMCKLLDLFSNLQCLIKCLKTALRALYFFHFSLFYFVIIQIESRRVEPFFFPLQDVVHRPTAPEPLVSLLKGRFLVPAPDKLIGICVRWAPGMDIL